MSLTIEEKRKEMDKKFEEWWELLGKIIPGMSKERAKAAWDEGFNEEHGI